MITAAEFRHGCCNWGTPNKFFGDHLHWASGAMTLVTLAADSTRRGTRENHLAIFRSARGRGPVAAPTPASTSRAYPRAPLPEPRSARRHASKRDREAGQADARHRRHV